MTYQQPDLQEKSTQQSLPQVLALLNELKPAIELVIKQNREIIEQNRQKGRRGALPPKEWFSANEVHELTGVGTDHIYRLVSTGVLLASNIGGIDRPTYRIHRKDIDQWMETTTKQPMPPSRKKGAPTLPISRHLRPNRQPASTPVAG